jgi:hypothetical protein
VLTSPGPSSDRPFPKIGRSDPRRTCAVGNCVALAIDGSTLCAVHANVTIREWGDVPIHCNACGELIRIKARWIVRGEGAFHNRVACLNVAPQDYVLPIGGSVV